MAKGSVRRYGAGWRYVIELGIDPGTGRRLQATKAGFATKREADEAMRKASVDALKGDRVSPDRQRLGAYLDSWLETVESRLRPTTFASYEVAVARIKRHLGAVPLQALKPLEIERFYGKLAKSAGGRVERLSAKSIRNTHVVLRRALADAERLGLVNRNPAAAARPPVPGRVEQLTWSAEELQLFFESLRGDRLEPLFLLIATTGMRRGEALGLRWRDIDFDGASASVVQTNTTVKGEPIISATKTNKSRRNVALGARALDALRAHRTQQREERLLAGPAWRTENELVFTDEIGDMLHPDKITRYFERKQREAGLSEIRLHDLRHSYATLALKAGIHPKVVSERLGHATVGVTLDLYSHVTKGMDAEAAEAVERRMFGI